MAPASREQPFAWPRSISGQNRIATVMPPFPLVIFLTNHRGIPRNETSTGFHRIVRAAVPVSAHLGTCFDQHHDVRTSAGVNDNGNSFDQDTSYAAAGAMTTATIAGFSATHNTMYGQSGFSHVTALERQGGEFDSSSSRGSVSFTAVSNDGYSISGSFENSARGYLYAHLYDFTATAFVYEAFMSSNGPAIFDLAGPGLNGFLIAGHEYQWTFETNTVAGAVGDDGATASGTGSIQFFSAVPEPSSLLVWWTLGLVGLVGRRRCQA